MAFFIDVDHKHVYEFYMELFYILTITSMVSVWNSDIIFETF
jgi:hypothetical protein